MTHWKSIFSWLSCSGEQGGVSAILDVSKLECKPVTDDKTSSQSAGAVEEHWNCMCAVFGKDLAFLGVDS